MVMNKKNMVLLMAAAFLLVFAVYVASVQETKGVVVKIEGGDLSVLDSVGQMVTIGGHDPVELETIKVGDKVVIRDGKIFKEMRLVSARPYPHYLNEINLDMIQAYPR